MSSSFDNLLATHRQTLIDLAKDLDFPFYFIDLDAVSSAAISLRRRKDMYTALSLYITTDFRDMHIFKYGYYRIEIRSDSIGTVGIGASGNRYP